MVGGEVVETIRVDSSPPKIWVNAQHRKDQCAIYVVHNRTSDQIRPGDSIWWQGRHAMWTPQENRDRPEASQVCGVDYDIQIKRIGYSGVSRPGGES